MRRAAVEKHETNISTDIQIKEKFVNQFWIQQFFI